MSAIRRFPKHMTGGLYFGPALWRAKGWVSPPPAIAPEAAAEVPAITDRTSLLSLLRRIELGRTDAFTPALADQIVALGEAPVRVLVLNLLSTQPESALAAALTDLALPHLRAGLSLLDMALNATQTVVAVDRHDQITQKVWSGLARSHGLQVKPLLNKYPLAHPLALLRVLCRRAVLDYAAPAAAGLLIVDPVTCWALGRAAEGEVRFSHRPMQVFVDGAEPLLTMARIGQPVLALITQLGLSAVGKECIVGGMLTGRLLSHADELIGTRTDILTLRPIPRVEPSADCIGCGWCVRTCPTALNPAALLASVSTRVAMPLAYLHEALGCIDCGLCSYLCPSRLPLAATIRRAQAQLLGGHGVVQSTAAVVLPIWEPRR